jgi:putative MATE family efflux protein
LVDGSSDRGAVGRVPAQAATIVDADRAGEIAGEKSASSQAAQAEPGRFTRGSTLHHVISMTAAGSVGLMAIFIVDFLSLFYVARLHDPNLTAAVGYATQVMFFFVSFNIGLTIAIGALVARALGAGRRSDARRLAASGLMHVFVVTLAATLVVLPFRGDILFLFGARDVALAVGIKYLAWTMPASVFLGLGMAFASILRSVGDARRAMYVTLFGAIATAVLDPLFIFGLGFGVQGAAIVTVISRIVLAAVGIYGTVIKHDLVARPRFSDAVSDLPALSEIALPAIMTNLAAPVANAYAMRIFSQFGQETIAAFAIIDRVTPVAFGVLFALSSVVGPIMSQNLGAQLPKRVQLVLTDSFAISLIYVILIWLLLWQISPIIVGIFHAEGDTARLVTFFCTYGGALWLFLGAIFVSNAAFNNLGFPILSTGFNWGRATLGTMPFVTFGALRYGPEGGFVGLILGASLFGIAAVVTAYFVTLRLAKTMLNA